MEKSNLIPFLRDNLDILFVGLNPAKGSNSNNHYFSVNQSFWNQLYISGLTTVEVDKSNADIKIFGSNKLNYNDWNFGITDLVVHVAESDSSKIKPTIIDCERLKKEILTFKPFAVVILHRKVLKKFVRFLGFEVPVSNTGYLGKLIPELDTKFYNIAFPHGNSIPTKKKIENYKSLKHYILNRNK